MPRFSESSFGTRIENARKLYINLLSFSGYNPPTELAASLYHAAIATLETKNMNVATKAHEYSNAVGVRQSLYTTNTDSLPKTVTQIVAAVRSSFGKNSKQHTHMRSLAKKITGSGTKKNPDPPIEKPAETADKAAVTPVIPTDKSISQSERGFGNRIKVFADIVATVGSYGATYKSGSNALSYVALQATLAKLSEVNRVVTTAYVSLRQVKSERLTLYNTLSTFTGRIKDAVQSQYGTSSTEFKSIKGITV